ncbi:MAG TPA: cytochrome c oxidase subunit II [Acidimicrobiia bacterium]|nr:cytochrome c oxidase subunit II [Acidimicrobiia bacterium]
MLGPAALLIALSACSGSGPQSSLEPQGPIAQDIDGLWELVLILATIVFVLVMIGFFVSIFRFRERKNDDREPKQVHGNTRLEIVWTIIPAVLLAVLAVPTIQTLFEVREVPEGPDVLQVRVTGHQWWWEFEYPDFVGDDGRVLNTANELHIPAETKVNLTMTSADVIHSFWIPPLNGKRDVVPGRATTLTLEADGDVLLTNNGFGEGVILGQCAEFCGLAHADMRMRVFVHSDAEFAEWAQGQLEPAEVAADGPAAAGYETFTQVCTACHQATVQLPDGTIETVGPENFITAGEFEFRSSFGPNLTHFGGRTTFGGASFDTPWANPESLAHLEQWLANPADIKPMDPDRNDIPNGRILGMPNLGLSGEDIDNLIAMLEGWD